MSLQDALQTLSNAHGPAELARAFSRLQGHVRSRRQALQRQIGNLAQTYLAAMEIWDTQKREGVPKVERLAGLERTLRAAWPQTREWKYLCNECGDLGLVYYECGGGSECGRVKRHLPHTYGRACHCVRGEKFRAQPKVNPEADYKQAGFTKVGRR
jgi:hypothetical protein